MTPALVMIPFLLVSGFGISFFFHGAHDITYAPAVFAIMMAGLVCALPALRDDLRLPRGICVWLALAFWGYLSISLIWSSVPFASLVTWLNLTVVPVILLGLLCSPQREVLIKHCAVALMAATVMAALFVLWEFFSTGVPRASGLMLNPNNMAALVNLSLLPLVAYVAGGGKTYRLPAFLSCLILFAALMATGSRGGLFCLFVGMAVIALVVYKPVMMTGKPAFMLIAFFIAIFAGFYFLTPSAFEQSLPILGDRALDASSFERIEIWKGALAMLHDHWLGGTGLGTFYLYYSAYRLDGDAFSAGHWAHFDALQMGTETGILAIVLFYALAIAWAIRGIGSLVRIPTDDPRRAVIAGCLAALLALFIHAHIEFQLYVMANLIMAAVLMAAFYSLTSKNEEISFYNIRLEKRDSLLWSGAFIIVACLMSLTLLSSAAGIYFLKRAQTDLDKGQIEEFSNDINLSRQYSPRSFADADVFLAGFYIDLMAQAPVQMTADDRITAYHDALQLLNDAQAANPAWADIDHKRAKLYVRIDDAHEPDRKNLAISSWRQALEKNPLHYHAREELTRYLIKQGRVDDAYAVIQDGLHRPMTDPARAAFTSLQGQIEPLVQIKRQYRTQQTP